MDGAGLDVAPVSSAGTAGQMIRSVRHGNSRHRESAQFTEAFARELTLVTGIPVTELIQAVGGGFPELQGTWVHP